MSNLETVTMFRVMVVEGESARPFAGMRLMAEPELTAALATLRETCPDAEFASEPAEPSR